MEKYIEVIEYLHSKDEEMAVKFERMYGGFGGLLWQDIQKLGGVEATKKKFDKFLKEWKG